MSYLYHEREFELLIKLLLENYLKKGLTDEMLELSIFIDKLLIQNKDNIQEKPTLIS